MGSAREDSLSKRLAKVIDQLINGSTSHEIIDLKNYNLPFFDPENPIIENRVQEWRSKFAHADAVIFLVPNYNSGYSGIVKNGIDALGTIAKNKIVGLIGYSGGYDGGKAAIDALMPVVKTLEMRIVSDPLLISMTEHAFMLSGDLKKAETKEEINKLLASLYKSIKE